MPADGDAGPLEDLFPCDTYRPYAFHMQWVIFHWRNLSPTPTAALAVSMLSREPLAPFGRARIGRPEMWWPSSKWARHLQHALKSWLEAYWGFWMWGLHRTKWRHCTWIPGKLPDLIVLVIIHIHSSLSQLFDGDFEVYNTFRQIQTSFVGWGTSACWFSLARFVPEGSIGSTNKLVD